jgi:hypothetical protein
MRERVYFVGVRKDLTTDTRFSFPSAVKGSNIKDYLIDTDNSVLPTNDATFQRYLNNKYNNGKFDLNKILSEDYLILDTRQSDLRLYRDKVPTLRTGRHGILYVKDGRLRKLSGYEALLLQGFPKEIADRTKGRVNETRLLSQAGNAMTVTTVAAITQQLVKYLQKETKAMVNLVERGSQTAKNGFANEHDIVKKFNSWKKDIEAQKWLQIMNYHLDEIECVKAVKVKKNYKADVNVQVQIKLKSAIDVENIQVKLVSNSTGFNQIDKRWLKDYDKLWDIPDDVYASLQYFTGELPPYKRQTMNDRRMWFCEMSDNEIETIIKWISGNKILIVSDILRGRGEFSAEWVLVAQKTKTNARWVLKNINEVMQHYSQGDVCLSPQGSMNIGRVLMQRKGGDGGRETANMLQFKIEPLDLFDL